jgi:recombinational DNA repair protein RecT
LILGFPGLLELARRSGQFRSVETRVVHENDDFDLSYDPEPKFRHSPNLDDPGRERLVYAYARLTSGELAFEVMTWDQVEAIRRRLPEFQANSPAWKNFWGEMARKVVLKRLLKRLPSSIELAEGIDRDEERIVDQVGHHVQRQIKDRAEELADRLGLPLEAAIESTIPDVPALESVREPFDSSADPDLP